MPILAWITRGVPNIAQQDKKSTFLAWLIPRRVHLELAASADSKLVSRALWVRVEAATTAPPRLARGSRRNRPRKVLLDAPSRGRFFTRFDFTRAKKNVGFDHRNSPINRVRSVDFSSFGEKKIQCTIKCVADSSRQPNTAS